MYRLRRYFPPDARPGAKRPGPPVLMVHPMMMSADMWDVTRDDGAVGILHNAGIDPWVIDFGSPDKVDGGMDRNLADHVVALSEAIDTIKAAQSRLDFLRQLHDREALLPREQQRRFLASEGWIAWSGPAIAELLKQFIAHNRMMSGGFSIHGDLVTLSDIDCPVLAVIGEVDDIGQPASVRGIKRAAPKADVYEFLIRAGHFGLVVGSKAASQTWPTVAQWVKWIDGTGEQPDGVNPMALQPAEHTESG